MYKKMYDEYKYLLSAPQSFLKLYIKLHEVCYLISERAITDGKIERSTRRLCQIMCQKSGRHVETLSGRGILFFTLLVTPGPLTSLELKTSCKPLRRRENISGTWKLHDRQISHYRFRPILFSNEMRYI